MISKQIAEKFEGKISLETEAGKGSIFSFTFKLQHIEKRENYGSE
jgi:signal transduction histidine kinase